MKTNGRAATSGTACGGASGGEGRGVWWCRLLKGLGWGQLLGGCHGGGGGGVHGPCPAPATAAPAASVWHCALKKIQSCQQAINTVVVVSRQLTL